MRLESICTAWAAAVHCWEVAWAAITEVDSLMSQFALNCAATSCSASATSATVPAPVTLKAHAYFIVKGDVIKGVAKCFLAVDTDDVTGNVSS